MKMRDEFILSEFTFAKKGISDRIHTNLALKDISDIFIKYGHQQYTYDEKRDKIILEKNFAVKLNTERLETDNFVTLEFYRYYHRFYAVYATMAGILSIFFAIVFQFPPGIHLKISINLIFFLIPLFLLWLIIETIKSIKGIKPVDYSKKADRIFLEMSNAIKEKSLT